MNCAKSTLKNAQIASAVSMSAFAFGGVATYSLTHEGALPMRSAKSSPARRS